MWRQTTAVTQPASQPGIISSVLFNQTPEMPRHTTRDQEFPRIDPNEVRQLPRGEAFVISGGRAQRVRFHEAELWEENIETARREIERRRKGAPATSSGNGHAPPPDDDPDLDF